MQKCDFYGNRNKSIDFFLLKTPWPEASILGKLSRFALQVATNFLKLCLWGQKWPHPCSHLIAENHLDRIHKVHNFGILYVALPC